MLFFTTIFPAFTSSPPPQRPALRPQYFLVRPSRPQCGGWVTGCICRRAWLNVMFGCYATVMWTWLVARRSQLHRKAF